MTPAISDDPDVDALFDDISLELVDRLNYPRHKAEQLAREYYTKFTDVEFCTALGIPLQDDDFFFHESPKGVADRIVYYLILKGNPNPSAFIEWRRFM